MEHNKAGDDVGVKCLWVFLLQCQINAVNVNLCYTLKQYHRPSKDVKTNIQRYNFQGHSPPFREGAQTVPSRDKDGKEHKHDKKHREHRDRQVTKRHL